MSRALVVICALALLPGCLPGTKLPFSSPIDDTTAERWCGVAVEGSAIYGDFSADLDAQTVMPAVTVREIAPPISTRGDRGPGVRAWQEHLAQQGFSPGPIDGLHGPQTERATDAWLQYRGLRERVVAPSQAAASWAADYERAKGVIEDFREGILALCQLLDDGEPVTQGDLLREGFMPAAEAFGDVVELHRDEITQPRSVAGYDHERILRELRIVQAEAMTALARR